MRLIKLTLDETIQEQNSLLDGSAIHNRLKYLGLIDKPYKSSPNKFNNDKLYSKNIDSDYKYKYLVFDDHPGVRQIRKKPILNTNDMGLSNNYDGYNSNYKLGVRDYPSTIYDDYNNPYYTPISSKKYSKTMNIQTPDPQEYQVYYFPTSKPIPQYPRHTTERFYRRKPVKQYPVEEVPYWPTRYPKPVRVVERQPSYPIFDYDYPRTNDYNVSSSNIDPYTHRHRTRYFPSSDMYHSLEDNNDYYESDLRQRPFSSITRPCSPVYSRDPLYDNINLENSGSLLEKKIRDYVWNPNNDRIGKYTTPSYEKSNYYNDFKPSLNKHRASETFRTRASFSFDSQEPSRKNDVVRENVYRRNSIMTPQERKSSTDNSFQSVRDDDHFSESTQYKKKTETPVHIPKRISFDLDNENIEIPNYKTSIGEIANENTITKERKPSILGRRESITKIDDKRRTSLLPNDDYPTSKPRVIANDKNSNSRRESFSKQENLNSIRNSFESDKYLNLKNKPLGNDLNLLEKNVHSYNNDFKGLDYDHSNNSQFFSNTKNDINNDIDKDIIPNENARHKLRRDSNDTEKSKLIRTTEKSNYNYQDQVENISNKKDKANIIERRDSYKNEQKYTINENIPGDKLKPNNIDNQIEKEYNNYSNDLNNTSKNISPLKINHNSDINNVNKYNTTQQETDNLPQYISNKNGVENENNFEKTVPYSVVDDSNKEDIIRSIEQDSSDLNIISKEPEPSQDILIDEFKSNTDYYQDHYNDDLKEPLTHEYEPQPEHDDDHVVNDNNYYTDELADADKIIPHNDIEPVQQNENIDENNEHDEYYYQKPTDDVKESPIEMNYENPQQQENEIDKQPNDDYYYQNYSNADSKEQPENQYSELDHHGEYANKPNEHDDYYYQNPAEDTIKEQQGDQPYVEPNYQENYGDQQATHDDYYYQNYDDKGHPENQYTESTNQGEYGTEHIDHDNYYDQNHPKDNTDENQPEQHYPDTEQPAGNYVDGEQSNYYYENNSNIPHTDHYDEHAQQGNYAENQHINDNYYYEKHDENYDASMPKEQYDGYVDEQHEANSSYYPESQANNYDPQQNYENNRYQAQPYDQNPNNENYDYSDNVDENKSTN